MDSWNCGPRLITHYASLITHNSNAHSNSRSEKNVRFWLPPSILLPMQAIAPSMSWIGAVALCVASAVAHEPMESTTVARLQHERLEMVVTFSPQMASALIADAGEGERRAIGAATFSDFRPRLLAKAAELFEVRDGEGVLAPTRTSVALNKMGEPEFVLIFPEPRTWPARMRIRYLNEMPKGYGGTIQVFDENETALASRALARDGDGAEVAVNPVPEPIARGAFDPRTLRMSSTDRMK